MVVDNNFASNSKVIVQDMTMVESPPSGGFF